MKVRFWLLAGWLAGGLAIAQTAVKLGDLNQRNPPEYSSALLGQNVTIHGTVNALPYHFPLYTILTIEDAGGAAALQVRSGDSRLDNLEPGDQVTAAGRVTELSGMPTIIVDRITEAGHRPAPAPVTLSLSEASSFQHLSRLIRVRGQIQAIADTWSGAYLDLKQDSTRSYRIFLPRRADQPSPDLGRFSFGDQVEVVGSNFQYKVHAPYTEGFEMLAQGSAAVVMLSRHALVPPWVIAMGIGSMVGAALVLWLRERRLRVGRDRLRRTYHLAEEILSASSADAILKGIEEALPSILNVTRVRLYSHNRATKTLDPMQNEAGEGGSISLTDPPPGPQAGAVACFHYRTLLVIPDIDRSPFPMARQNAGAFIGSSQSGPKSLLLLPMMSQGEVIGVLELDQDGHTRDFSADEQALAQHLANQIAVALRLIDQRSVQEQLFRTEKLAAVGRLISGVVNELQTPLSSISDLARRALDRYHGPADRELSAIASEAQRAASIMTRLVSFAGNEQVEARPVAVGGLLRGLIEFREGDWKASGIKLRDMTSRESLTVLGSQGQLEQVFLNLLVHAEQSLADAPEKSITIRTSVLARRLLIEIAFSADPQSGNPEVTAAILGVTRSVIAGHGGEVRLIAKPNSEQRFEVELPLTLKDRAAAQPAGAASHYGSAATNDRPVEPSRRMTALVIETDETAQRQLLGLLSGRGYRVVPVNNADTGLELAHRMKFDAAFCSVHAPGLNWVELSERMHSRVGAFILMSDGFDSELSADFEGDGKFVLPKPFQEHELARVLHEVEHPMAKVIPITKNGVA
jgi:GAF domain-containing protein/CheY-like chemotaxis protein